MTQNILYKICNDIDDSLYKEFNSMTEYIESTLNEDKELYKYFSLEGSHSFMENVIRDNTIKFGAPNKFNDPFECMSVIGITSFNSAKKQFEKMLGKRYSSELSLLEYAETLKKALSDYREKSLSKYGLLCLSGKWDDILMWSHYANDHKGVVVIFQFDKNHDFYNKMMKVTYKKGITYFELDHPNYEKKVWESFSTKDPIWKYENEYRIINTPSELNLNDGNGIKPFPRALLKGIIFGCRICKNVRADLIEMVKKYDHTLNLFDIIIDESEVKLYKVQEAKNGR